MSATYTFYRSQSDDEPKLVLIEWVDSAQPVSGWHFLDDAPDLEIIKCQSVGWLVGENEGVKMLSPNLGDIGSDHVQGSGFIRIPSSSILKVVELCKKIVV